MSPYALVLYAGSSSLKFCVFRQVEGEEWAIETRGQIEGIGTTPRLIASDDRKRPLLDRPLRDEVRTGKDALNSLAEWLKSRYRSAEVVGVGHRVVHGGTGSEVQP
jgi:acetate kinase